MIKVLAIDDEPLALLQLQKMIESTPYFELAAACSSAFEAIKVMEEKEVDAIFADINMPDLSGLDFVRSLRKKPIVVFTTAYSQYAVDGYKVDALDYLLKPFGQPEFQRAASKVKQQYDLLQGAKANNEADDTLELSQQESGVIKGDFLFVKVDYRIVRLNISDIMYIESQSEYLKIYLSNARPIMVLMRIKNIADILPPDRFVRIHRSYVVNMSYVLEISRLRVRMDETTYLPIGDSYKENTQKFINDRLVGK